MFKRIISLPGLLGLIVCSSALAHQGASRSIEPGLAGRNDIIYFEDFETNSSGGVTTVDPALVKFGRRSLKTMYIGGGHGTEGAPRSRASFPVKLSKFHVRHYIMFDKEFDFDKGGKIAGSINYAPGKRWTAGKGGKPSHGDDGFSMRLCWGRNGSMSIYTYHADMKGKYGESPRISERFKQGVWVCVELMIKINTLMPATPQLLAQRPDLQKLVRGNYVVFSDGVEKLWVNGKLVTTWEGIRHRDIPELALDNWSYGFYFGGLWPCPKDQYIYMDNVVVAHNYIGPAVYTAPKRKKGESGPSIWAIIAKREAEMRARANPADPLNDYQKLITEARSVAMKTPQDAVKMLQDAADGAKDPVAKTALAEIIDGFASTEPLKQWIIKGASPERVVSAFIRLMGAPTRCKVIKADDKTLTVVFAGATMPVEWTRLKPKTLYEVAKRYASPEGEDILPDEAEMLELFAKAHGLVKPE